MKLKLVDINHELVEAWKQEFKGYKNVEIICGDILELAENTIVSAANSHGIMDGGLDGQYTDFFWNVVPTGGPGGYCKFKKRTPAGRVGRTCTYRP